jgi:hypothetical protein
VNNQKATLSRVSRSPRTHTMALRGLARLLLCASLLGACSEDAIRKVFVVFSNHLDIGYTENRNGSSAAAVVNDYFSKHIPKAIETSEKARAQGARPYRWMTHSWIIDAFRFCNDTRMNIQGPTFPSDLTCPSDAALARLEAAARRGDIGWHAFPFNGEPELFTPALFDAALNLTFRQDAHFGRPSRRTLSQRDVPGLTRASIPLLRRRGVTAISVGENSQCAPLSVPPIFVWRDNATNTSVLALFHALGYGGSWPSRRRHQRRLSDGRLPLAQLNRAAATAAAAAMASNEASGRDTEPFYVDSGGQLVMTDAADPHDDGPGFHILHIDESGRGVLRGNGSRSEACVRVAPAGVAICYAWKSDNTGPHGYADAELIFEAVGGLFPHAELVTSDSFDDFVEAVEPFIDQLPVVSAELGDTWVMGATADPLKVSLTRAASRAHAACMAHSRAACVARAGGDERALMAFERLLMLSGEHTWGWNGGHIRHRSWSNEELRTSLATDRQFQTAVRTWQEQRASIRNAVAALPPSSTLSRQIGAAFAEIEGPDTKLPFDATGMVDTPTGVADLRCGDYLLGLDATGAIASLRHEASGRRFADSTHPLARLHYQGLGRGEYVEFVRRYVAGISEIWPEVAAENLFKPNLELSAMSANASLVRLRTDPRGRRLLLDLSFPHGVHTERGAPATAQVQLSCPPPADNSTSTEMQYTVRWFNKTATHVPETIWLSHVPLALADTSGGSQTQGRVLLDKLGSQLDAMDADLGCDGTNRLTCGVHLHGVGDGGVRIRQDNGQEIIRLASRDSSLVSVGEITPLPTPLRVPSLAGGVHFALVGNVWNTNYPFWYPFDEPRDKSSQFRFVMELHP